MSRPIELAFIDSHTDYSPWSVFDEDMAANLPSPIRVRGYLVYEDEDWYVIAVAVSGSCPEHSLGRLAVPKLAVVPGSMQDPALF